MAQLVRALMAYIWRIGREAYGTGLENRRRLITFQVFKSLMRRSYPGVAQSGSARALGAWGRWFESSLPDAPYGSTGLQSTGK